jgi:hypothetical protein
LGLRVYRYDQPRDEGTGYLAPPRQVRRSSAESEGRFNEVFAGEPAVNMGKD